jgi:subtilisin family serine protease
MRSSTRRFQLANHVHGAPVDPPRWAEQPRTRKEGLREGTDTSVAVLDSGISRHPWLSGSYCEPLAADALDTWDLSLDYLPRHIGHGTFVAGVVLQYAPRTVLLPHRVVDLDGDAEDGALAATVDSLIDADPDVLNISLVPEVEPGFVDEGTSATLQAVRRLQQQCGTVVVLAAGNNRDEFPVEHLAPEDELTVMVGALDLGGRPAWFSNRRHVNIWAPGVDVISSFVHWSGPVAATADADDQDHADGADTGVTAHFGHSIRHEHHHHDDAVAPPIEPVAPFTGWARWNGTSFAAPAVAGAVAAEISSLSGVPSKKDRRRLGLMRVLDGSRDIVVDGEKTRALGAAPVALEGPALH